MRLFIIGLALIGLTAGLFVGLSKSPVVAAALPLLLGLIAGGGALVWPGAKPKPQQLGAALIAVALSTLIGTLHGALLRTGGSWRDVVLPRAPSMPDIGGLTADDAIAAILLNRKLAEMKVDAEGRQAILAHRRSDVACIELEGSTAAGEKFFAAWDRIRTAQAGTLAADLVKNVSDLRNAFAAVMYRDCGEEKLANDLARVRLDLTTLRNSEAWRDLAKLQPALDAQNSDWVSALDKLRVRLRQPGYGKLLDQLKAATKDLGLVGGGVSLEHGRGDLFR